MDEMIKMVGNVGFPIVVAAFLLLRVEQRMESLTTAIAELREAILLLPREQAGAGWANHSSSAGSIHSDIQ